LKYKNLKKNCKIMAGVYAGSQSIQPDLNGFSARNGVLAGLSWPAFPAEMASWPA
jgi:hypothetical protein